MNERKRIELFSRGLYEWFLRRKRTLPWRDIRGGPIDSRAYKILVSEVMLQQTQVSRVIEMYKKFIQKFSHAEVLAVATNAQVILAWRGLGYNTRALRLRDATRMIVHHFGGRFPRTMEDLLRLPGVGHYTAGAIMNFAFHVPTPCMDVNVRRIVHRFFFGPERIDGTFPISDKKLLVLLGSVLEYALQHEWKSSAEFFAALMDFGALVCTRNAPKWDHFNEDLRKSCLSYGKTVRVKRVQNREPGRVIAGRFVPNRIVRGRIVEVLRDHSDGLLWQQIGPLIAIDWTMGNHRDWLLAILERLEQDQILCRINLRYALHW